MPGLTDSWMTIRRLLKHALGTRDGVSVSGLGAVEFLTRKANRRVSKISSGIVVVYWVMVVVRAPLPLYRECL